MHFTYKTPAGHLQQGDILKRTKEIQKLLRTVHPHYYKNKDYKYLIVLTQTCDLVRGRSADGGCKARYISLAAVRSLKTVLEREKAKYQHSELERRLNYCSDRTKIYIHQFLERLFNNNEPNYFYLHDDVSFKLKEPTVAFLNLSVAIKSSLHYETCLEARIAQLEDTFQAKLGWLVGNMYSRVGTNDWVGTVCTDTEFKEKIEHHLRTLCLWVEDKHTSKISQYEKNLQKENNGYQMSQEEFNNLVVRLANERESRKDQLIDEVTQVVSSMSSAIDADNLKRRLKNNPKIMSLIK